MVTGGTEDVSPTGATLSGSFSGATGRIQEAGFEYAESEAGLDGTGSGLSHLVYDDTSVGNVTSGSISVNLGSLNPSTTYYYRAFVAEFNEATNSHECRYGSVKSFTTASSAAYIPTGWLELPAVTGSEDFVREFYGSGVKVAANRNYSYNYSYSYFAPLWTAYPLCGTHKNGSASSSSWVYNPSISSTYQVNVRNTDGSYPSMYGNSTYSRGHIIPQADRKSDDTMNSQTYYVTNQTPQRQNNFNGSIWGSLEEATRGLVSSASDTVYVVTGPAYRTVGGNETIEYLTGAEGKNANPENLAIPNYFWKALLKVKWNGNMIESASAIGFWFEHRDYSSKETYTQFAVSIDEIERRTGFDLFANLPGSDTSGIEKTAEANTSWTAFQSF